MKRKTILTIVAFLFVGVLVILAGLNSTSGNEDSLKRLDEISSRLAEISARQSVLSGKIDELEWEYFDLNEEAIVLNDEASAIFLKLVDKSILNSEAEENEQPKESPRGETFYEVGWYPGKLTEDGSMQEMPYLYEEDSHARFKELCELYGLDASMIYHLEDKYGLVEGILPAILIAETSGGHNGNYVGSGCYNLGNVNNNDRGDRVCFDTKEESIEKVAQTLNNKYLGGIQTLGCLSNAGSCLQKYDTGYRYASSDGNRERNVKAVLDDIYSTDIDPVTFIFRK